jgi:hypothetical protein
MQVKAKDAYNASVEQARHRAVRLAAEEHQRALRAQMADKQRRDYLDGAGMAPTEAALNRPLLAVAESTVVAPHPIAVNLP